MTRPPTRRGRRHFLGSLPALPLCAWAQSGASQRVACPTSQTEEESGPYRARIEKGLAAAGVRNAEVRCFFGKDPRDMAGQVREAVEWRPDVILAPGPFTAQSLRDATRTIPIVFFAVPEPESLGLVRTLARPGGNLTGSGLNGAAGTLKRLEIIPELLPKARRVATFIRDPKRGDLFNRVRERVAAAAETLKLQLEVAEVGGAGGRGFKAALAGLEKRRPDAVLPFGPYAWEPDGSDVDSVEGFVAFERRTGVPVVLDSEEAVRRGAVLAMYDGGSQLGPAIEILARVLKGESPATIPVQFPTRFLLAVNREGARAARITLPPSIVLRADLLVG